MPHLTSAQYNMDQAFVNRAVVGHEQVTAHVVVTLHNQGVYIEEDHHTMLFHLLNTAPTAGCAEAVVTTYYDGLVGYHPVEPEWLLVAETALLNGYQGLDDFEKVQLLVALLSTAPNVAQFVTCVADVFESWVS